MKTAILFPGQGSQYVGMGKDLFDGYAEARQRFERANEVLDFDIASVMFGSGDESKAEAEGEALKQTDVTQPALLIHSMASWAVLQSRGVAPAMAAGHSLGEYSALTAAGALTFDDGVRIARERGRLMAGAGSDRKGAMAAVLGLDAAAVTSACDEVTSEGDGVVQPANFNSTDQVVISGDASAVERAMSLIGERGARRVIALPVSGAFHSPLMEDARAGLAEALDSLEIRSPACPVYLNVTAEPTRDPEEIRRRLLEQLTSPVRWTQIMQHMKEAGADRFIEVGAGKVLSGLAKRTLGRDAATAQAGKFDELADITPA
ncbi:MAG: ACP S-malonyltransferase [Acidimicrobiia bacterium]|nr:ACP S-malonyltransferase [Acidimicrobiia bacterium]